MNSDYFCSYNIDMRISEEQKSSIVHSILKSDKNAQVYLVGSRVDDEQKGGDIDLLVISKEMNIFDLIDIRIRLSVSLNEFPFDVVLKKDWNDPFVRWIRPTAIKLS